MTLRSRSISPTRRAGVHDTREYLLGGACLAYPHLN
jgi:hypothetical protein